jgi:hypothetical protein
VTNLFRAAARTLAIPGQYDELHSFQGNQYWNNVLTSWEPNQEGIGSDFVNLVGQAYKANAVVAACEFTRMGLVSEARPQWRRIRNGRRGDLFGNADLAVLERPWPGGTFRQLAARMVLNADMGGTAFVGRRKERPDRLMVMRPDWVVMVLGSQDDPDEANYAMDADLLGVLYYPGGHGSGRTPVPLLADEVAVWAPNPDPVAAYRGVPWLSSVLREVDADAAATTHKLMFFQNGATPQLILSLDPSVKREALMSMMQTINEKNVGVMNAYRTLALQGATPHVVGKDLEQLDFKATQGAGETRVAAASGVHPVVAALSEGMAGSSLNAGNFRAACRLVADRTLRPLWGGLFASLETIMWERPSDADLWYSEKEISFLQEDRKDAAEIEQAKASTIVSLVSTGFTRRSAVLAVEAEDNTLLEEDPNWVSVQLQQSNNAPPPAVNGSKNGALAALTTGQG